MNKKNMPKMNLALAETYVTNWEKYKKYFSKKALTYAIRKRYQFEFITFKYIQADDINTINYHTKKGYELITPKPVTWQFEEWRGEWMKKVNKLAYDFKVPDPYQLGEEKLLRDCLIYDFPYLKSYAFNCYRLDGSLDEIYIHCDETKTSLYCPINAFVEKNPDIIKQRHESYMKSYYDTPDRKKYLDKELSIFNTDFYKKLCEDIID